MSTSAPLPDPGESAPPEPELVEPLTPGNHTPPLSEPFPALAAVQEPGEVFVAELAEPAEAPLRRRRQLRPERTPSLALPPSPPHPGFAWAMGWCLLMLFVCQ